MVKLRIVVMVRMVFIVRRMDLKSLVFQVLT